MTDERPENWNGQEFYAGDVGESRTFGGLHHASTDDGQEVTVAFGEDDASREGHTLIADGHVGADDFYDNHNHDHFFGENQEQNGWGVERGAWSGPETSG